MYIKGLKNGEIKFEKEQLTLEDRFNDYILTSLRTIWGVDLKYIEIEFGEIFLKHLNKSAYKYICDGKIERKGSVLLLSSEALFISDSILLDLFYQK